MSEPLALFPLHAVLCPGGTMPLHIFEPRYRELIGGCIERREPFGVVLIRDGRDTGPLTGSIAPVGTTAVIRQASRYADGRLDIVTVGERRFRVVSLDPHAAAWLTATVDWLAEPTGAAPDVLGELADRVGRRFLAWLERLGEPATSVTLPGHRPLGAPADATTADAAPPADAAMPAEPGPQGEADPEADASRGEIVRRQLLLASARRLVTGGDPAVVAWRLTALVTTELPVRQALLEIPDTAGRLERLGRIIDRERLMLDLGLRPYALDATAADGRQG